MALPDISLAQFNRIASGSYNAGQIDIQVGKDGKAELVKINNHVWSKSKNQVDLSPERILEVKEAFINALQKGGVSRESINTIRAKIGLPADMSLPTDDAQRKELLAQRFKPLSRAEVRDILDQFAHGGRGFTVESRNEVSYEEAKAGLAAGDMSAKHVAKRESVNMDGMMRHIARGNDGADLGITDTLSLLSMRSLAEFNAARSARCTGDNAVNERNDMHTALVNSFKELMAQTLKMLPADVHESGEFRLLGETVKLVKGEDGALSAIVGKGALAMKVNLKANAETFAMKMILNAVNDEATIGTGTVKGMLGTVFARDLDAGLVAYEKESLTRKFSALVLSAKSGGTVGPDTLIKGDYNTGILEELAERALDGEKVGDTNAAIKAYHEKIQSDNADLPPEIKEMLSMVALVPLEKPTDDSGEMLVRAPITGGIDKVVKAIPPPPPGPVPVVPRDIGGLDGIKDFVANLVFSDDTMVGDVTVSKEKEGGAMRKMLSSDKNVIALAECIKDPGVIDRACAPQIAGVVKEGIAKMAGILDPAFQKANGKTLAEASADKDFVKRLSLLIGDPAKIPGAELAKFDNILLAMATKGCEKIQNFINDVFQVGTGSVNDKGGIVNDPYTGMSAEEIADELDKKSLNQLLDSASNSDAPGQVGFFRQVVSTYFTSLGKADKRSCFAAAMKYAQTFDFHGLEGEALESAKKVAINKFTGAVLKGTSPLLQKMMQGLPKEIMGEYADALSDMKSSLAPIPRKIVQAHLAKIIKESQDLAKEGKGREIESIELTKSLGAASVGEAFLCAFKFKGEKDPTNYVVKIMRHDAEKRVNAEAEIFTAAAKKIPGMDKTWDGQLKQYMTEFDFRNEAQNVMEGEKIYDIADKEDHPLHAMAPKVRSMKLAPVAATKKNVMVAEVARGTTVDKFFKERIADIRKASSAVFKQDPATGRIMWQDGPVDPATGKSSKVPVFKDKIPAMATSNLQNWLSGCYYELQKSADMILQATKVWFYEATLGSGKFHGDTHAGNLMVSQGGGITFIDFGNLYKLDGERADGVNEKTELLRVITGAAFRDRSFVLKGFEKLMSPAGRAALAANRDKAEAILDTVLEKSKGNGAFSFNIVYRLQAAVVELQKLGMELPPQINCFIQSLVRLSNTVSEMNTIMNQCKAMLDVTKAMVLTAPKRDELDLIGQAFDIVVSEAGKKMVPASDGELVPAYKLELQSPRFGGQGMKQNHAIFKENGEYTLKVADRLRTSADPVAEAGKLADMMYAHCDRERDLAAQGMLEVLDENLANFQKDYAAAKTPEDKENAVKTFAYKFAQRQAVLLGYFDTSIEMGNSLTLRAPTSFASAVTDVLFDSFDALEAGLDGFEKVKLAADARSIATDELGLSVWSSFSADNVFNEIVKDSKSLGGDNAYQIDIGV